MISNPSVKEGKDGGLINVNDRLEISLKFNITGPSIIPYYTVLHHYFGGGVEGSLLVLISPFLEGLRGLDILGI